MTNKILNTLMLSILALSCLLFATTASAADSPPHIAVANFSSLSEQQFKKHWQRYNFSLFGNRTRYQLVLQDGQQVLHAASNNAASGLVRKLSINLAQYPILSWRWKTTRLPTNGDDHSKAGDDHSLRLYVIFDIPETTLLGWFKNNTGSAETHALNYIWANKADTNSQLTNPYSDRSIMIAASSGKAKLGQWQTISRDVAADYQRAFGHKPPPVTAIAVMTDSDNTDSELSSFYGDIYFSQQQNNERTLD